MKYNKKIISILVLMCVLFLSLVVYLTYFSLFKAGELKNSNYNRRLWEREESVIRGSIYDRNGTVLAESKLDSDGTQTRVYPYGGLYAHVIGYNAKSYGKTNLELEYNDYLLKTEGLAEILQYGMDADDMNHGCDLITTIDHDLMETARDDLKGRNGAVVALNPKNGEVLCLYSNPTFDPNESSLTENWADLSAQDDSPFLPRATKGLYAPGSTFKIAVTAEALKNGMEDYTVEDEGSTVIDGYKVSNAGGKAYGNIDLKAGFKYSSNVLFSNLGVELGADALKSTAESFMITQKIPFDIETSTPVWKYTDMTKTQLAAVGIGQGQMLTTPLNMAMVAAAIANDGVMMKPYLVESAISQNGVSAYNAKTQVLTTVTSPDIARKIGDYMQACVESGTGANARISGITVAGKTGTAQNEREGKDHAWFVCYAPKEDPQIAVAVFIEYSGSSGGTVCAPIARDIIQEWLQ